MKTKYINLSCAKLFKRLKYKGAKLFYQEKIKGLEYKYWDDGRMVYATGYKYKSFPKITYFEAIDWLYKNNIFIQINIDTNFKPAKYNFYIYDLKNEKQIYFSDLFDNLDKLFEVAVYESLLYLTKIK